MSAEAGFLEQLRAAPGDDVTRLVYADWLEERGDARGEYLRLEVEFAGLDEGDARAEGLLARLGELRGRADAGWLAMAGKRFDVWLLSYPPVWKLGVILGIHQLTHAGMAEAKSIAESLPACILGEVPLADAEYAAVRLRWYLIGSAQEPPVLEVAIQSSKLRPPRVATQGIRRPAAAEAHDFRLLSCRPEWRTRLVARLRAVLGYGIEQAREVVDMLPTTLRVYPTREHAECVVPLFASFAEVEVRPHQP